MNLKRIRKEKNYTLEALAKDTNLTLSAIHRIESGKTDPRLSTVMRIADVLDVSLDELVGIGETREA